jgi:hypothetical protein
MSTPEIYSDTRSLDFPNYLLHVTLDVCFLCIDSDSQLDMLQR